MLGTLALFALIVVAVIGWMWRSKASARPMVVDAPSPNPPDAPGARKEPSMPPFSGQPMRAVPPAVAPPAPGVPPRPMPAPPAGAPAAPAGDPNDPVELALARLRRAARFGFTPMKDGGDNLAIIFGVEPHIAELLQSNAIRTFTMLAATPTRTLVRLITDAGERYAPKSGPDHWPVQARLCVRGEWEELAAFQRRLKDPSAG